MEEYILVLRSCRMGKSFTDRLKLLGYLGYYLARKPILKITGVRPFPPHIPYNVSIDFFGNEIFIEKGTESVLYFAPFYERGSKAMALRVIEECGCGKKVFFDVGANAGAYSIMVATLVKDCRVYAIEPEEGNFRRLCRNIGVNGLNERISVFRLAFSDTEGSGKLHLAPWSGLHTLEEEYKQSSTTQEVKLKRFDRFAQDVGVEHVCLAKIDVEGHSMKVLWGAVDLLKRKAISYLLIEVEEKIEGQIENFLVRYGYRRKAVLEHYGGQKNILYTCLCPHK